MKNWIIALLILILPLALYFSLDKNAQEKAILEAKAIESVGKPKVIKFYSTMCLDCKKLDVVVKEVMPRYIDKVDYQNIDGQASDKFTQEMVKKYNVNIVPTMIFIKKDGIIYKKTEGYLTEKELTGFLNMITK